MSRLSFSSPPARLAAAVAPNHAKASSDAFYRDLQLCVHRARYSRAQRQRIGALTCSSSRAHRCPDGSCVLATAEDRSLNLFAL